MRRRITVRGVEGIEMGMLQLEAGRMMALARVNEKGMKEGGVP